MPFLTLSLCFLGPLVFIYGAGLGRVLLCLVFFAALAVGEEFTPLVRSLLLLLLWSSVLTKLENRGVPRARINVAWLSLLLLPVWLPSLCNPPPAWAWALWPGAASAGSWNPADSGVLYHLWGAVVPAVGTQHWIALLPAAACWFLLSIVKSRRNRNSLRTKISE